MNINFKVPQLLRVSAFVIASVVTLGFASCKGDDCCDVPIPQKAQTSVLNLLQGIDEIDLHAGTTKLNSSGIDYGTQSAYFLVDAGEQNISVFQADEADTLASHKYTFARDKSYSAFAIGEGEDAEIIISEDNLTNPSEGKVKIRFANLAALDGNLDLWLGDGETALVEDAAYKTVGTFVEADPAEEVSLAVKINGEEEDVATLENAKLEAGKIYTVYAYVEDVEGELQTKLGIAANK